MMDCHEGKKSKGLQQVYKIETLSSALLANVGSFLGIGDRFKVARLRKENTGLRPFVDMMTEVTVGGKRYSYTHLITYRKKYR